MFERFTDAARAAIVWAQESARELGDNYIGTEHVLLGLLRQPNGSAVALLESRGIAPDTVRAALDAQASEDVRAQRARNLRHGAPGGHIPFTPRVKKVLELSLRESLALGHDYIDTGHLLLALLREGSGTGAKALIGLGLDIDAVRESVVERMPPGSHRPEGGRASAAPSGATPVSSSGSPRGEIVRGEIVARLIAIEKRLGAIERHLGMQPPAAPTGSD